MTYYRRYFWSLCGWKALGSTKLASTPKTLGLTFCDFQIGKKRFQSKQRLKTGCHHKRGYLIQPILALKLITLWPTKVRATFIRAIVTNNLSYIECVISIDYISFLLVEEAQILSQGWYLNIKVLTCLWCPFYASEDIAEYTSNMKNST